MAKTWTYELGNGMVIEVDRNGEFVSSYRSGVIASVIEPEEES